jgi:DNA topoisomerase-2
MGDWHLIKKRVYDATACTDSTVSVYLNGKKLPTKSFEDYISLYIGKKTETPRVFATLGDRWQIGVCLSPDGDAEQVSFVNGICTDQGGKHVAHILDRLSDKIIDRLSEKEKKSMTLKPAFVKANLFLFVKCTIVNPSFDTQTKRKLTTLVKDFGSKCEIPEDFVDKVIKLGILERAKKLAEFKALEAIGKKTDGHKVGRIFHPKLVDADAEAIRKESHKCTMVFAEGDSAISFMNSGIRGIPDEQRKYWGHFPLRGKLLNVRVATVKQLETNEEIMMIKKIMGLQERANYELEANFKKLRYGRVIILSDADEDGNHIKGLFMNYIHHYWPSLLKREGFICEIATPIVKVTKTNSRGQVTNSLEFFTTRSHEDWCNLNNGGRGWNKPKYYKGMGTYEPKEAIELCRKMRVTQYCYNYEPITFKGTQKASTIHYLDLAFAKGMEDDRKDWLNNGDQLCEQLYIEGKVNKTTIDYFINNRLKSFSMADNVRSIPHVMDGYKPAQRKVIYAGIKKDIKKEIKVAQFAGAISELCEYHHGEASLHGTIVGMAQDYVGAGNITLLYPAGAFGTRKGGGPMKKKGDDAASARYIFTRFHPIASAILNPLDEPLLTYAIADGKEVEPIYFLPTYPLILDGSIGIGTGYSSSIYSYNPVAVIANMRAYLRGEPMTDMHPWYRGYKGKIICLGKNKYITIGEYMRTGPDSIKITELPVGAKNCKSFVQYKEFLESLLDETVKTQTLEKPKTKTTKTTRTTKAKATKSTETAASKDDDSSKSAMFKTSVIKDFYVEREDDINFVVSIQFKDGILDSELANNDNYQFEKKLKLAYAFSTTNMHAFTCDGSIKKFNSPEAILEEFMTVRLTYYEKRRLYWIERYKFDYGKASAKYRFITEIMDETLDIRRQKRARVDAMLETRNPPYPKYSAKVEDANNQDKIGYDYLLHMYVESFTEETLEKLRKEQDHLYEQYTKLESQTNKDVWIEDLDKLSTEYDLYVQDWTDRTGVKDVAPRTKIHTKALSQHKKVKSTITPVLTPKITIKIKPKESSPADEADQPSRSDEVNEAEAV